MSNRLKNSTIIVTGANGIIGLMVCQKALQAGAHVMALDLAANQLENLLSTGPAEYKDHLLIHQGDIREKEVIQTALERTLEKWGSVDGLHNNAAWKSNNINNFFDSFENYSLETWQDVMSVNLDSVMLVDQVIGSHMANQQSKGAIVHTASIYGIVGPDQNIYDGSEYMGCRINTPAVYAASKGAIIALTKYLATYWANQGVRVNSITPGGVESGQNETFVHKYSKKVPLGRMAKSEEIADGVLFLLSEQSSYITGHNLVVDGGFSIW